MLQNVLSELRSVLVRDAGTVYMVLGAATLRCVVLGVLSLFTSR